MTRNVVLFAQATYAPEIAVAGVPSTTKVEAFALSRRSQSDIENKYGLAAFTSVAFSGYGSNVSSESDRHQNASFHTVGGLPPCPTWIVTFSPSGPRRWHSATRYHPSAWVGIPDHWKRTSSAYSALYTASTLACACVARLLGEQSTHRVATRRSLMSVVVHSCPEIGFVVSTREYRTYEVVVACAAPL